MDQDDVDQKESGAMFIYYYVTIAADAEDVRDRLQATLSGLDGLAGAAYREGEEIRARIMVGPDRPTLAKTVRLETKPPVAGETEIAFPIVWEATGARLLFPRLEADLVVAPLGPDLTQLTLRGSYRPPFGTVGRAIDRTVLHRVAEASIKTFVDNVARAVSVQPDRASAAVR